ncbi:chaperonin 10-like protein [Aspergillus karnatakaensis]|uniref:zinc-binding alcohol dehydrogenase family protein n=1 Tax=Aspergillus karnatakaensis TaxID=1810916 RepID=UPI003CCD4C19
MDTAITHQAALVGAADGTICATDTAPVPGAIDDRIVARVKAVSISPVDAKIAGSYVTPGCIAGFEFAGVVQSIGPDASDDFQVGDRVCAAVFGMNPLEPSVGAFAEYTAVPHWTLLRVPSEMSFEEGASVGISFMTIGLALFSSLNLPGRPLSPTSPRLPVLVSGGSSTTGTAAIQLLRLAGYDPIATCSESNFDLVRGYGAAAVFDYRDPTCAAAIKRHTKNELRYAVDCISTSVSMQLCYEALGRAGGRYTALDPYNEAIAQSRKVIQPDWVMGPHMLGEEIAWPAPHGRPAKPEMVEFTVEWTDTLRQLLCQGLIRPHPLTIRHGALPDVVNGIADVRARRISGTKLVYALSF